MPYTGQLCHNVSTLKKERPSPYSGPLSDHGATPSTSPGASPHPTPTLRPQDEPRRLLVSDIVGQHGAPVCAASTTLTEAAALLLSVDRTAALVACPDGSTRGIFTENDVVAAYYADLPTTSTVGDWLDGNYSQPLADLTVLPEEPLRKVAALMLQHAAIGGTAIHHLYVEGTNGKCHGLLSPLDLCRAACGADPMTRDPEADELPLARVARPRGAVPTCPTNCTIKQLLHLLLTSRFGGVLIVDAKGVHGMVTPRDVLQAFVKRVPFEQSAWSPFEGWLGGIQINIGRRVVPEDMPVAQAAAWMAVQGLHHLVLVRPGTLQVEAVASALDLTRCVGGCCTDLICATRGLAGPLLVADEAEHRDTPVCPGSVSLQDACDILVSSGRSAAIVADDEGTTLGVVTENDILTAQVDGTSFDCEVREWLRSGAARGPGFLLPVLTVPPTTLLTEAAARMAVQSMGDFSCHHLLVSSQAQKGCRILSSLDIARSLCEFDCERAAQAANLSVASAMKTRDTVPAVGLGDSLEEAFEALLSSRQNCVLVLDEDGDVCGAVTPRDGLRAFSEHLTGSNPVDGWLRGLGASVEKRVIASDASLSDAAAAMAADGVHHLLVTESERSAVVGVLSSLDLVRALASDLLRGPDPAAPRHWGIVEDPKPTEMPH